MVQTADRVQRAFAECMQVEQATAATCGDVIATVGLFLCELIEDALFAGIPKS
jgi:hypothetical protein